MSISGRTDKQIVVHAYDGILFSHKREGSTDTRYNVHELQHMMLSGRNLSQRATGYMMPF